MNNLIISTDKQQLDIPLIHDYIANQSYWGKGRSLNQMTDAIDHSMCFGAYLGDRQIGFARVVTDTVHFAYLADVFIVADEQRKGFGHQLMETILAHPKLKTVNWMLRTNDAHSLYQKYGFTLFDQDGSFMRKVSP